MQHHTGHTYAGDQCEGQQQTSSSAGCSYWSPSQAYLAMPPPHPPAPANALAQAVPSRASPQLHMIPGVASIKDKQQQSLCSASPFAESSTTFDITFSSTVTSNNSNAIFSLNPDSSQVMEHKVRQFYAADGTSFIEHVPGHCLVFIPNTTNVEYVLRELRKIRRPKPKAKPRDRSPKPTNAFIKYRNHKIDDLKSLHPDISQTEISRMAGKCWKTEPLEVKNSFMRKYQEEKRIYDMNKAKRARTDSDAGSDAEAQSDCQSSSSPATLVSPTLHAAPHDSSAGLGLGLGLSGAGPAGFNPGRRRSHTLPPGGFSRSGAKRRISQELRKHLASKSNNAYLSAANMYNPNSSSHVQPFPPQYEFTFTPPQAGTPASSTVCMDPSPYMTTDASPMVMPLNPNFPIAEFSSAMSQHPTLDASAFSTSMARGLDAYEHNSLAKSLAETHIPTNLSMIDTSALSAFSVADSIPVNAFAGGYLSADAIAAPMVSSVNAWPLQQHAYTLMHNPSLSLDHQNNNSNNLR
ncbi:hypothetical protein GGI20_003751 [Coemansia sp. BCRC 34301]|nr:hypothetical protein GGI20_003751 [Coemansia sp. BCRC 34301]